MWFFKTCKLALFLHRLGLKQTNAMLPQLRVTVFVILVLVLVLVLVRSSTALWFVTPAYQRWYVGGAAGAVPGKTSPLGARGA